MTNGIETLEQYRKTVEENGERRVEALTAQVRSLKIQK